MQSTGEAQTAEQSQRHHGLQARVLRCFRRWSPSPPAVVSRGSQELVLTYSAGVFAADGLIYVVQRKEKTPPWVTVYSGGKTTVTIGSLRPAHPHRFRLKVVIKPSAVDKMAAAAPDDHVLEEDRELGEDEHESIFKGACVESRWSEEVWSSTTGEGTTAACFCMAVRCGYLAQVQQMLEERPELVAAVNSTSGLTPLATAARRGDTGMVRQLLLSGAEVDQTATCGRTALHVATLHGHVAIVEMLLASGADFTCRDVNSMRVEHFAVDSEDLEMVRLVLGRGKVEVVDSNGWTPLFRAVIQGASAEIVKELIERGSEVDVSDRRGLTLAAAARLLKTRLGKNRDSILKLVDSQYQHEKVLANFTRITKKISSIQSLLTRK